MYLYSYIYDNKDSSSTCPEKKKKNLTYYVKLKFTSILKLS